MGEITHEHLIAMQNAITGAVRHEVSLARAEFQRAERGIYRRIDELKEKQDEQNGRVNHHEAVIAELRADQASHGERLDRVEDVSDTHRSEIAKLDERTKLTSRGLLSALTAKQKAALWSVLVAALGTAVDWIRHLVAFVVSILSRGVQP